MQTYRNHDEIITMFKELSDRHSKIFYESIGKTYQNNDIWLFKIGNFNGGTILIDGCMHGWEDMGTECMYLFLEWLLESGAPEAQKILDENYILFIPVLNYDSAIRGNCNHDECPERGVDLNRNFPTGWKRKSCGNGPYYTSTGVSAGSEPETQALLQIMDDYEPSIYINMHYGGGPIFRYAGSNVDSFWKPVHSRILQLFDDNDIVIQNKPITEFLYNKATVYGDGLAVATARSKGIEPFLWEVCNKNYTRKCAPCNWQSPTGKTKNPPYELMETCLYPIHKQIMIGICESVAVPAEDLTHKDRLLEIAAEITQIANEL